MRVTSLQLQNFRSFENMEPIELDQINVLIGANNAGKTSILRALYLIQQGGDNIFADVFLEVVLKKIKNKSYTALVEQMGPGILVVGLESPWLDAETFQAINKKWIESGSSELYSVFKWVYLGYRDEGKNVAIPWEPL